MEQKTGAGNRPRDRGRVAHVAFNNLDIEAREIDPLAGFPQQSADMIARPDQRTRHGGPNEARSSRDQNLVSATPPTSTGIIATCNALDLTMATPRAHVRGQRRFYRQSNFLCLLERGQRRIPQWSPAQS